MAVKLVRAELELDKLNNDKSTQLPVLEITSKEVKAPEYFQGKVTARTNNVFTSDGHQRQIVWQNNFARYSIYRKDLSTLIAVLVNYSYN